MVRLQRDFLKRMKEIKGESQFHYGSITTSIFGTTAIVVVHSLNSTMVRLQLYGR